MESKTCTMCSFEKHINCFFKRYSEGRGCNCSRGLKRYYGNEDKVSNQQKFYYDKIRVKNLSQKQNKRCIQLETYLDPFLS